MVKKIGFEVPGVRPEQLQPVGMDFTKDGKLIFVPLGSLQSRRRHRRRDQGGQGLHSGGPAALAWRDEPPTARNTYVANGLTNDLTVIDVESLKAEKSVPVGRLPWGVAVMP